MSERALSVRSPCVFCTQHWLSGIDPFADEDLPSIPLGSSSDAGDFLAVSFEDGPRRRKARFYPHPRCRRHVPFPPMSVPVMDIGAASPIKDALEKKGGRGLFIALALADDGLLGRGTSAESPAVAMQKAVFETIERLCTIEPPRARLVHARAADLGDAVRGVRDDGPARFWCEVEAVDDGARRFVALEYAQLASRTTVRDPLVLSDSTGIALHVDRPRAIANATLERFERAGIARLCATRIAHVLPLHGALPESLRQRVRSATADGCTADATLTSIAGVWVAAVLLRSPSGPALVCGAGAAEDPAGAIEHALEEAMAQRTHAFEAMGSASDDPVYARFLRYLEPAPAGALLDAWGFADAPRTTFDALASSPEEAPELLVVDRGTTLSDYLGLSVVQVIAPSLPLLGVEASIAGSHPVPFG